MTTQLGTVKKSGSGSDAMELRSMTSRAMTAERRLNVAQNQLVIAEEKLAQAGQSTVTATTKWEARVKEYESRIKATEEKYKRERQGGKERATELENNLKWVFLCRFTCPAIVAHRELL